MVTNSSSTISFSGSGGEMEIGKVRKMSGIVRKESGVNNVVNQRKRKQGAESPSRIDTHLHRLPELYGNWKIETLPTWSETDSK